MIHMIDQWSLVGYSIVVIMGLSICILYLAHSKYNFITDSFQFWLRNIPKMAKAFPCNCLQDHAVVIVSPRCVAYPIYKLVS